MKGENWINGETCRRCGNCMEVCPAECIGRTAGGEYAYRQDHRGFCIACGQCMCICPSLSVHAGNLDYEKDFFDLAGQIGDEAFYTLIKSRRSIRNYKNLPVPREMLEKIVEAAGFAPPSLAPVKTSVVITDSRRKIEEALAVMTGLYEKMLKAYGTPVGRAVIRMNVGKNKYRLLREHVVPLMKMRMPGLKSGERDTITRGAPAMLIFHADGNAGNAHTDGVIAVTYAMLAAHSLGLGACVLDLIHQAFQREGKLKAMFGIPLRNEVTAAIVVGYPKFAYKRGIRRSLAGVDWI